MRSKLLPLAARTHYLDQLLLGEQTTPSRIRICESPFPARAGKFVTL